MSRDAEGCRELLARHFGPRVLCEVTPAHAEPVLRGERSSVTVTEARASRRREFALGRACAQRLIARLGLPPAPIPAAENRSPVWPAGVVGSITHSRLLCAVAVARDTELRSLGLDTEPDAALEPELWPTICTPHELASLLRLPPAARGRTARLVFSAKECAYKCLHPVIRAELGFHDVQIALDAAAPRFEAVVLGDLGGVFRGRPLLGFHVAHAGSILTGMTLPTHPPALADGRA